MFTSVIFCKLSNNLKFADRKMDMFSPKVIDSKHVMDHMGSAHFVC